MRDLPSVMESLIRYSLDDVSRFEALTASEQTIVGDEDTFVALKTGVCTTARPCQRREAEDGYVWFILPNGRGGKLHERYPGWWLFNDDGNPVMALDHCPVCARRLA